MKTTIKFFALFSFAVTLFSCQPEEVVPQTDVQYTYPNTNPSPVNPDKPGNNNVPKEVQIAEM